jgi:Regulator of ribonuclease activity B
MSGTWWSRLFPRNDSGWEAFGKFAGAHAADAATLAQLTRVGANLEKPREVLPYFYVPTPEAADQTAPILRQEGTEVTQRPSADAAKNPPNPWLILARKITIVNPESVKAARARFAELSGETRGQHDGWEAAAQP